MASLRQPTLLPNGSNVTVTVSADSVRGTGLASRSELHDVTADGSAVWTSVGSSTKTTTYTPATGSRLVNNWTSNVATFGGGSYSAIRLGNRQERRFDNLRVAVNGTEYTLNGASRLHSGVADRSERSVTPARFESSITERWWRVFTATSATL